MVQTNKVDHSSGQANALGLHGKKADKRPSDKNTAPYPTRLGWVTLKGLSISGSFFLRTIKDIATSKKATVTAKLPVLMSQTRIVRPKSVAAADKMPRDKIAT